MATCWTWCFLLAFGLPLATAGNVADENKDSLTYVMAFPVEDKLIAEESETVSKAVPLPDTASSSNLERKDDFSSAESVPTPEPSSDLPVNGETPVAIIVKEEDATEEGPSQEETPSNSPLEIVSPGVVYPRVGEKKESLVFSSKPSTEDKSYAPSFPFKSKPFPQEKEKFSFSPFAKFHPKLFHREDLPPQRREDTDSPSLFDPSSLLGKASTFLRRSLSGVLPFQGLGEKLEEKSMFSIVDNAATENPMISKLSSRQLLPSLAPLLLLPPLSPISSLLSSSNEPASSHLSPLTSRLSLLEHMDSMGPPPYNTIYPQPLPPMNPAMMMLSSMMSSQHPSSYIGSPMSVPVPVVPPSSPMFPYNMPPHFIYSSSSPPPFHFLPPPYSPAMFPFHIPPPVHPTSIVPYSMPPFHHPPPFQGPPMIHRPTPLMPNPASLPPTIHSHTLPFSSIIDPPPFFPPPPPPHMPFRAFHDFPPPPHPFPKYRMEDHKFSHPPVDPRHHPSAQTTQEIQIPIEVPVPMPVPVPDFENSIHPHLSPEPSPGQITEEIILIPRGDNSNFLASPPDSVSYKVDGANDDTYLLLYPTEDGSYSMRPPLPFLTKSRRPMAKPGPLYNTRSQRVSPNKLNMLRDLLLSKTFKVDEEPRLGPPPMMISVDKPARMQRVIEQTRIFTRVKPSLMSPGRMQSPEDEASFHRPIFRPPAF